MSIGGMLLVALIGMVAAQAAIPAESPLLLQNRHLTLAFDRQSGAWIGLTDRQTGEELVAGPVRRAMLPLAAPVRLDTEGIRQALEEGRALSLEGEWLYTPAPQKPEAGTAYLAGRFDAGKWEPTPVPSRRGAGDDRLHERAGDFWYRREFACPAGWAGQDLVLALGAVDDFDTAYLNGKRIGATGSETPHHWETPRLYRIPARLLRRDQPNLLLLRVTNGAFDGGIAGPVVVGLASALRAPETVGPPLLSHTLLRQGKTRVLRLVTRAEGYEYRMEYTLPDDTAAFSRQLTVCNVETGEKVYQTATYAAPPLRVGPRQAVIFPGSLPVGDIPTRSMEEGDTLGSRSQDPLALLWDAGKQRGVGVWFHSEEEYAPVSVRRAGDGMELRHAQGVIARLKPGQAVTLGRQSFWLAHGSRDDLLRGVQRVYRSIGLRAPARGLARLREKVLYCGHPGGPPELNYRTYGGFRKVQAYASTLRKMGIDLLWFLPIWEHGDGRVWNLYSPFDHFQVSPLYGTTEELKQLSAALKENGIGLMFDLVPHGPPDFTPLAKAHPEWVCRDADGKLHYEWSQYAFDNAHPGWQDYMRRAAEWDVRQFGAIGARVDCGAGSPPNWNPAVGDRPSLSTLAGGLGMNRAIREGFLKAGREVVLLPEEYTGANIYYRVADLTYDAQLYFLMADLQARNASPEAWAEELGRFLHDQQQTLPPGALKMRWISNHDTVSWTFQAKRPVVVYGVEKMRALWALCACIEGVPMVYQGDEDPAVYGGPGVSNVDYLSHLFGLRRRLTALRRGSADYLSARATGGVFACLRETPGQRALVFISFNPAPVQSAVTLPASLSGNWTDAATGERFALHQAARIPLSPYQTRVLTQAAPTHSARP